VEKLIEAIINYPVERGNNKGIPSGIVHFDIELTNRQQRILDTLPEYDSRGTFAKSDVGMVDLSALTAKTGDEFAMFTKSEERLIIRGNAFSVNVTEEEAKSLSKQGYKWSGHTHPGADRYVLIASKSDKEILKNFPQDESVIYNSAGRWSRFGKE
jgi:hypothetical protein